MRAASGDAVKVAGVVARSITGLPVLMVLREPGALAVLFPFIVLLTIFHEAALAFSRGPYAFARDDFLDRLYRWRLVQLLDEARVRTRPVLSLGVH